MTDDQEMRREHQAQADRTGKEVWWRGEKFSPTFPKVSEGDALKQASGTRCYKVITQRDEYFQSRFDPVALQTLLNSLAKGGWRVVSMVATDVGSFWGTFWAKGGGAARQELVVLLERVEP